MLAAAKIRFYSEGTTKQRARCFSNVIRILRFAYFIVLFFFNFKIIFFSNLIWFIFMRINQICCFSKQCNDKLSVPRQKFFQCFNVLKIYSRPRSNSNLCQGRSCRGKNLNIQMSWVVKLFFKKKKFPVCQMFALFSFFSFLFSTKSSVSGSTTWTLPPTGPFLTVRHITVTGQERNVRRCQ